MSAERPLEGIAVVTIALNVPGPVAAARLRDLGAAVTKVEPPDGDPLALSAPEWYAALTAGQRVERLDLKTAPGREALDGRLESADVLVSSQRPAALERLGLTWERLHSAFPRLCQVMILGRPGAGGDLPGHDLNYVGACGLVRPPSLPVTLVADLAGAEAAATAALAVLLARERTGGGSVAEVSLAEAAQRFAEPLRHGLTAPDGILGGGFAGYGIYETSDSWVTVAALEPQFRTRLAAGLGLAELSHARLREIFRSRSAAEWEQWAREHDLPIERLATPA